MAFKNHSSASRIFERFGRQRLVKFTFNLHVQPSGTANSIRPLSNVTNELPVVDDNEACFKRRASHVPNALETID
jgi:hypothetical protein